MVNGIRIRARELGIKVGRSKLLQEIFLAFDPGEFVGVLGPSGCGKSTLLRALAGLQPHSSGEVTCDGTGVENLSLEARGRIAFVPQDDIVHGPLTVERALYYSAKLRSVPAAEIDSRVTDVIEQLGLKERRKTRIDRLSGGQRKRVSIGVELLTQPFLLFLDEPTAGLDPALEEHFMELCQRIARDSRTVIMSTHVMQSLDRLDVIVILLAGFIQWIGPPKEALAYFHLQHLHEVYKALANVQPQAGWERYRNSPYFPRWVTARL